METSSSRPGLVSEHSALAASSSNVRARPRACRFLVCRFQVCRIGMSEPRRYDMRIVPPPARPYIRRPAGRGRRMARREYGAKGIWREGNMARTELSPKAKELPMVEVIERETVNEAIEA